MTYAKEFIKLSWGGKTGKEDQWVNAVNLSMNGLLGGNIPDFIDRANLSDYFNAVVTAYCNGDVQMASFNTVEWVKMAHIDEEGKYVGDAKVFFGANPVRGTGTANGTVPQNSLVVSLTTDKNRGRASKGRIYPPAFHLTIDDTTGRVVTGNVTSYLNQFKTLFQFIASHAEGPNAQIDIIVASRVGTGDEEAVTGIRVGDVVDTQRRRRNKIREAYSPVKL